jgi:hypothetical protein
MDRERIDNPPEAVRSVRTTVFHMEQVLRNALTA